MYAQTQVKTHLTIFAMPATGSHRCYRWMPFGPGNSSLMAPDAALDRSASYRSI